MTEESEPEKIGRAAREFVRLAIGHLADEKGVHAETTIASVARMAGTFLFRSFAFELADAEPGQPVLSEAANEKGPRLVNITYTVLEDAGIVLDHSKVTDDLRTGHEPLLSFLESQKRIEPAFDLVRKDLGLSYTQAADAAALAAAMLIQQCKEILDPNLGFDLALFSYIEGAKTVPAAL